VWGHLGDKHLWECLGQLHNALFEDTRMTNYDEAWWLGGSIHPGRHFAGGYLVPESYLLKVANLSHSVCIWHPQWSNPITRISGNGFRKLRVPRLACVTKTSKAYVRQKSYLWRQNVWRPQFWCNCCFLSVQLLIHESQWRIQSTGLNANGDAGDASPAIFGQPGTKCLLHRVKWRHVCGRNMIAIS